MSNDKPAKRSVRLFGHPTSISLEAPFWKVLEELAVTEGVSVTALIERIDAARSTNLSSALRLYVLEQLRAKLAAQENLSRPP